jgi:TPP-dependent pyruvate/acetoin dehydrogenase alpha subunit
LSRPGGNPLFLHAVLSTLAAEGRRPTAESSQRAREVGPDSIARGVTQRLARLRWDAAAVARVRELAEEELMRARRGGSPTAIGIPSGRWHSR